MSKPMKIVIDASIPPGAEGHERMVPLTKAEVAQIARDQKRALIRNEQKTRDERNAMLARSDYTQLPDFTGDREAWAKYRQQLRDLPMREPVKWPTPPEGGPDG